MIYLNNTGHNIVYLCSAAPIEEVTATCIADDCQERCVEYLALFLPLDNPTLIYHITGVIYLTFFPLANPIIILFILLRIVNHFGGEGEMANYGWIKIL